MINPRILVSLSALTLGAALAFFTSVSSVGPTAPQVSLAFERPLDWIVDNRPVPYPGTVITVTRGG